MLLVGVMVGGGGGGEGGNCYFELHYEIILEDAIAFFIGYWVKNRVNNIIYKIAKRSIKPISKIPSNIS